MSRTQPILRRFAILLACLAGTVHAATFPTRPVKLILPYSPGGATEVAARVVAEAMARSLGQPVLIDNRPGAEGALAVQAGIAAEADGHTLVLLGASMVALPIAVKPPPFDLSALAPVSTLGDVNFGLFVPASLPARTARELLAHAKAQPAPLTYASISLSMDALTATLARAGEVELTRVPYKGGGQAMTDLIGGRLQVFFGPIGNGLAAAREGRLRLLATHPQRTTLAPEVPTLAEAGIASAATPMFMMVAVPAGTPRSAIDRLAQSVAEAMRVPAVRERLESLGVAPNSSTPEAAAELMRQAVRAYEPVVRGLEAAAGGPTR